MAEVVNNGKGEPCRCPSIQLHIFYLIFQDIMRQGIVDGMDPPKYDCAVGKHQPHNVSSAKTLPDA